MSRTAADIIEIGRDLIEVKEGLGHGNFLPWIEAEFGMSEWTARNFMNVADLFGKSGTVPVSSNRVLYALASPSTPEPVREEVQRRIEAGEKVTVSDVADLKRKLAAEKTATKEAKDDVKVHRSAAQEAKDERDRFRIEDNGAGSVSTYLNVIPDLVVHDGAAFASSLNVARVFGKRPDHVVAKVDLLVEQEPQCAPNFRGTLCRVQMAKGGFRDERVFELSRDGFALLAMGFTGTEALRFSNTTAR